jgi:phenylalanyl-tRNA synthetase beta chain
MKISLNRIRAINEWHKATGDIAAIGVDELVKKIGTQLGGIDAVEPPIGDKYKGIVIAKVVSCEKHPDADKLQICKIDDNHMVKDVDRDQNGYVQVVCGAPNVREGLGVAWLPPGTTVPNSFGKEPFVLEARELRGVVSNGMLASPKELDLGDSHAGLLEIDNATPGTDFAEVFGLNDDTIIDIENKMFTHRPDCFGFLGIARELAGIQGMPFKSPEWYQPDPKFPDPETDELELVVKNELPNLVPRFVAITMADVKVGLSPVWLQIELARLGQKSINNIVDYTNWFMLLTGQPIHIYDYDKVKALSGDNAAILVIRNPKPGETIKLLNGKEIEPRTNAMMVATDKKLICLGGAMGGTETEVDEHTKNIIIEAANWDMFNMRRTAMEHGIFTDAVTRFTKGQSPLQNLAVVARIVDEIRRFASGRIAGTILDDNHVEQAALDRNSLHPPVKLTVDFINSRLGLELSTADMKGLLENVEFKVDLNGDELVVAAPFWRTDIELREDVVEEVGRLYGYDKLPLELPQRDLAPASKDPLLELKNRIRRTLSRAGDNEVLTYSFVHGGLLDKTGQDKAKAFQISNALSPDLQYYRLSLIPSLLEKVHPNVKVGYDQFALFEIGKAHILGEPDPFEATVPKEVNALAFVYAAKKAGHGAPYYWAREQLMNLLVEFHCQSFVTVEPLKGADLYGNPWVEQMTAPFEPNRSAVLRDGQGLIWGVVGEFKASTRQTLKLPDYAAGFEIDPLLLLQAEASASYVPLPRFPKVTQDITLKVPAELGYQELFDFVNSEIGKAQPDNTLPKLGFVDIYQADDDVSHKNITFRLTIASYDRTLTDHEVNKLLDAAASAAETKFSAKRV